MTPAARDVPPTPITPEEVDNQTKRWPLGLISLLKRVRRRRRCPAPRKLPLPLEPASWRTGACWSVQVQRMLERGATRQTNRNNLSSVSLDRVKLCKHAASIHDLILNHRFIFTKINPLFKWSVAAVSPPCSHRMTMHSRRTADRDSRRF